MINIIILFLLATIFNSIGDALKFSGAVEQYFWIDFCWHIIKYFIQIPLWMLSGYFFINYWIKHNLWDFWHPTKKHFGIIILIISCVLIWQGVYKLTILVLT